MKYLLNDWINELKRRFGDDFLNWKFVCPACDRVNSLWEFKELGAEPDDAYCNCIGRFNDKGTDGLKPDRKISKEFGCNWAAYGLFKTLGKGDVVVTPDGKEVDVFAMAEVE